MGTLDIDTAISWRGRTVLDREGRKVGRLQEIYLDAETDQPAWAALQTGLFGRRRSFIPLAGARLVGDEVQVPYDQDLIKNAPNADPDVALSHDEEERLYEHYEVRPDGRSTADHVDEGGGREVEAISDRRAGEEAVEPSGRRSTPDPLDAPASEPATSEPGGAKRGPSVVRSEEEVTVSKRAVQSRLRLKKYVVTDEKVVPVQREEVRIERVGEGDDSTSELVLDTGEVRTASDPPDPSAAGPS